MKPFALYRMPGEALATRITAAKATVVSSCAELNGRSGFVIAPFSPTPHEPILLIEPEEVSKFVPDADGGEPFAFEDVESSSSRAAYASTFPTFHKNSPTTLSAKWCWRDRKRWNVAARSMPYACLTVRANSIRSK